MWGSLLDMMSRADAHSHYRHYDQGSNTFMEVQSHNLVGDSEKLKVGLKGVTPLEFSAVESILAWGLLLATVVIFFAIDIISLNRSDKRGPTMRQSLLSVTGWVLVGIVVWGTIWGLQGQTYALYWLNGYVLEWVLSADNLMIFHFIFNAYATPQNQLHKALTYGLAGAVIFRLAFFSLGILILNKLWWITFVFGAFLMYTGLSSFLQDNKPVQNHQNPWVARWITAFLPIWPHFDSKRRFFIKKYKLRTNGDEDENALVNENGRSMQGRPYRWVATMLLIVVLSLEGVDVLFAIDSTAIKLALIPDLFLAYSSTIVAMFGIRATFFLVEHLARHFELLKYGLSIIMIVIGFKIASERYLIFPTWIFLIIVVSVVFYSIVLSILFGRTGQAAVYDCAESYGGEMDGFRGESTRGAFSGPHQDIPTSPRSDSSVSSFAKLDSVDDNSQGNQFNLVNLNRPVFI